MATGLYPQTKVLSKNFDVPNAHTLAVARPRGAYQSLEKALKTMTPAQVTDEVKKSRLRGRGGAGFPTGMKWSFVAKNTGKPTYLVMNADESEPGAFKDRYLMERDPHLVVEGALVSAYAIEALAVFIYVRGEYPHSIRRLEGAIAEARAAGLVGKDILGSKFSCEVWVHPGAGAYICGEETGLLESLEGKRGHPRIKPPFPAVEGVFRCPTIINNVETLSHVPWIVAHGGEAFAKQGIPPDPANPRSNGSTGTKLMGVSGQVRNPGLWEFEPGITLRELVYGYGGGPLPGRKIKAVIPGGISMPVLLDNELDVKMGFDELVKVGSGLGTGTAIVMDDTCDMVEACVNISHFFGHESCGQCTPCREGCHWMEKVFRRVADGDGQPTDLDLLESLFKGIEGRTICFLADAAVWPVRSIVRKFRGEFLAKMTPAPTPAWSLTPMPKITIDGRVLEFAPGQTIIQVAQANGIEIPHYCYHPGLSVAGNCRICMVEVEKTPKPQIACYVQATDGMVVHTKSAQATEARAGVMEMLLVNHPLDCPICDQAGECKLQDYAFDFGHPTTRTPVEKTHLPKNVPFGAKIVYDGERCIKCTRCVRFTDEITQTHELSMGARGDKEMVIMTSKGEFTTPYAMNIIDLCPVGALTSKDFRFESRVWFMDFTESVCTGCARGCNVTVGARGGRVLRMTPRENQDVNRWWMCDAGRLGYGHANAPTRLTAPRVRTSARAGEFAEVGWEDAIDAAVEALRDAARGGVLADAGATLEELFLLKAVAGRGDLKYASRVGQDEDGFLIVNEKGANQRGAEALGFARAAAPAPAALLFVERGDAVPKALRDGADPVVAFVTDGADVPPTARVVFPLPTWAERDGLLANVDGIVQPIRRCRAAGPRDLRAPLEVLEEIRLGLDAAATPWTHADVVAAVRGAVAPAGLAVPDVEFAPASPRSVAAPASRTR